LSVKSRNNQSCQYDYCKAKHITPEHFLLFSDFSIFIHHAVAHETQANLEKKCWQLAVLMAQRQDIRRLRIEVTAPGGVLLSETMLYSCLDPMEAVLYPFELLLGGITQVKATCVLVYGPDSKHWRLDLGLPPSMARLGKPPHNGPHGYNGWHYLCRGLEKKLMAPAVSMVL